MGADECSPAGRGVVMRQKICLGALHPEGKYPDTDRLEEICPSTRHPEAICYGVRHPDATCLDTHCLEEICPDTLRLEGKMPWHSSSGRYMLWYVSTRHHIP